MTATRISDGRTIGQVLVLEGEADTAPDGYIECRDTDCPAWGSGKVEGFWRHFHKAMA